MDNKERKYNKPEDCLGAVQIADDVVADIVAIAATEVDGVAAIGDNFANEIMNKVGLKNMSKGVKLSIEKGEVAVEIRLTVEFGYNIPATSAKVQEKVKNTVENMTGLKVTDVNVCITGLGTKKED